MRTWCNESTTFYDFFFLGHESVAGSIIVSTNRPEQPRLQVKVTVEIEGRLNYSETTELVEHSRTGLYGVTTRTMEGRTTPHDLGSITAAHAEIFEYAPESSLSTVCGLWLSELLQWVFVATTDDAIDIDVAMVSEVPAPPPPMARSEVPRAAAPAPAPISNRPAPLSNRPVAAPEPIAAEPAAVAGSAVATLARSGPETLVATTNTGDRWEVDGIETYMGRSKQCSIVLKSQRVSRKHASITREDDGFYINDLGAANGIWAGTDKVEREKIEDGSEYIIGDVLVSFTYP